MSINKWLIAASLPLLLTGCLEGNKNTDELCADNKGLRCEELNMNDGQCRLPRTDLIWHRFEVLKKPTDANKITEYTLVAAYKKCLELASQIAPIDQSALKQQRFNALMHSIEETDRIVEELSTSQRPETLYFLWSQTGNDDARRSFLQLEGTRALQTAEMQYALATFYTTRDQEKTLVLLNNALELSNASNVNREIFKSLASINHQLGSKEKAYIWAMVAQRFEVPIASESELSLLYGFSAEKYDQLEDIAAKIEDAIEDGMYKRTLIPTQYSPAS
ncbi:DUF2989 domain-containing protein [Vibrio sp. T187]|uniref:DUF2989 domain-containing protein n=1 Tax=Vibrio TaxID=662 RepID=UPI0010C9B308|nr:MULTISPECIES: DUF2989 domain-containing protein [Vibrio]MBW3696450.1 DUF2989 domain-containing protein [Vibrio sp. T187]